MILSPVIFNFSLIFGILLFKIFTEALCDKEIIAAHVVKNAYGSSKCFGFVDFIDIEIVHLASLSP